jgi:hypothetical protein
MEMASAPAAPAPLQERVSAQSSPSSDHNDKLAGVAASGVTESYNDTQTQHLSAPATAKQLTVGDGDVAEGVPANAEAAVAVEEAIAAVAAAANPKKDRIDTDAIDGRGRGRPSIPIFHSSRRISRSTNNKWCIQLESVSSQRATRYRCTNRTHQGGCVTFGRPAWVHAAAA